MSQFDDFFGTVVSGSKGLAEQTLQGFVAQAKDDTRNFLAQ